MSSRYPTLTVAPLVKSHAIAANLADVEWLAVNTNVLDVNSRSLLDELVAHRVKPPA